MISFGILLAVIYTTVTGAIGDQIRTRVEEEVTAISEEARNNGLKAAARDVQDRILASGSQDAYYYLADPVGSRLAGNLVLRDLKTGWQAIPFSDIGLKAKNPEADYTDEVWGQGQRLADGSFLFVGENAFRVAMVQEAVTESFVWSAGIALLIAALAGSIVSHGLLRRIDAVNRTSKAIMEGKLKSRIPLRGTSDEIDQLSLNLNKLFDSNERLLESLKDVSTNIAHDLRTPLTRLKQGLEEASTGAADAKTLQVAIDDALAESDQLLNTFSALLRISQIESGSRRAGFRAFNLSQIISKLADAYTAVAEDEHKPFTANIEPNIWAFGDAELLAQAIANILDNALKHTSDGTRILLRLMADQVKFYLSVEDSGAGIPADERSKVFQRFYRLDKSRATQGTGLGLPLVGVIIDLHGYSIDLADCSPGLRVTVSGPLGPL